MRYRAKINIDYKPKRIIFEDKINIGTNAHLTINILKKMGIEDEYFRIVKRENTENYDLIVYRERLETQKELEKRIAKDEKYNEDYYKFHFNKEEI